MSNVCKRHHLPLACAVEKNNAWTADKDSNKWILVASDFCSSTGIIKTPTQIATTAGRVSAKLWAYKNNWKQPCMGLYVDALDSSNSWGRPEGHKAWAECARAWQLWTGLLLSPDKAYAAYHRDMDALNQIKESRQELDIPPMPAAVHAPAQEDEETEDEEEMPAANPLAHFHPAQPVFLVQEMDPETCQHCQHLQGVVDRLVKAEEMTSEHYGRILHDVEARILELEAQVKRMKQGL